MTSAGDDGSDRPDRPDGAPSDEAAGAAPTELAEAAGVIITDAALVEPSPGVQVDPEADDAPLLPPSYDEDALRVAVGATPRAIRDRADEPGDGGRDRDEDDDDDDRDDDGPPPRRSRKAMMVGAVSLVVGSAIAAIVVLGKINGERYLITCESDRVVIEEGRSFPPWGERGLEGAAWKPLPIPPEAPCTPRETTDRGELAGWFVRTLTDHAAGLLTAREVTKVDDAEAQLKQALLVARELTSADDQLNTRNEIERLLGDVGYWRASAKLRTAADALTEAAKQFDAAAAQRPRHVTDAAAWAAHVRTVVGQLQLGPAGATAFPPLPPAPSVGERPTAPIGVALPVDPGEGSGSATPTDPPAPPPPAAPPSGGVLL